MLAGGHVRELKADDWRWWALLRRRCAVFQTWKSRDCGVALAALARSRAQRSAEILELLSTPRRRRRCDAGRSIVEASVLRVPIKRALILVVIASQWALLRRLCVGSQA